MAAVVRLVAQVRAMRIDDLDAVSAVEAASYDFPWTHGIFSDCLKAGHPCWVLCLDWPDRRLRHSVGGRRRGAHV